MKKFCSAFLSVILIICLSACTVEKALPTVEPGHVSENVYENPSVGLVLRLDGDWLMNGPTDTSGENYQDMYAVKDDGTASMQVSIVRLGRMYGELLSVDEYIGLISADMDADMERAGYENGEWALTAVDFAGEKQSGVYWTAEYELEGRMYPYFTKSVYLKQGDYIVTVTVHSVLDDITDELLGLFDTNI